MDNFAIAEDTEAENTVAILREGDLEEFGIYVCKHCGTTFINIHQSNVIYLDILHIIISVLLRD